jgi:hypothetical protein
MTLLRHFPLLSHAFLLVSILAACLAQDAVWLLLIAGGAAAASWVITEGPRGVHLSRRVSLMLSGATAIWAGVLVAGDLDNPVLGLSQFAIWIAVIKLYERRSLEIEAERLIMAVLLMVLASMDAFDLLFGVLLTVWMVLGIVVILLFQLHYGAELSATRSGHDGGDTPEDPTIGARVRIHFRRVLVFVILAVACGSVFLFLLFPRGLTPQLAAASSARIAMVGGGQKSDVVLVSGTRIVESMDVVGEVTLIDERSGEYDPPKRLYLRTGTASVYLGGGRWTPRPLSSAYREMIRGGQWQSVALGKGTPIWMLRIELNQPLEFLPIPAGTVAMRSSEPLWLKVYPRRDTIEIDRAEVGVVQARVTGSVAAVGPPASPSGVPVAVGEVARRALVDRGIPVDPPQDDESRVQWRGRVAGGLLAFLQSSRFTYTLDLSRIGRHVDVRYMDPIERFLLAEPFGHCEYFAAAFVAMAQSVGLEARIVTGFMPQLEELGGHQYIIKDRDAHAWAEVRIEPDRWSRFDPAVQSRVDRSRVEDGVLASIGTLYRRVELWWRINVLGFDARLQEELAAETLPGPVGVFEQIRSWFVRRFQQIDIAFGFGRMGSIYTMSALAVCAVTLVLVGRVWRSRVRFRRRLGLGQRTQGRDLSRTIASYRELLDLLGRSGMEKPEHMTPLSWCGAIAKTRPDVAEAARRIVASFYAIRYGGQALDDAARGRTKQDLAALRTLLGVSA